MAPEQISGGAIDKGADIWAFGAVLYELLTGQRAFPGRDTAEVLAGVLKDEPRWTLLPTETPSTIRRLLQRCLAKDFRTRLRDLGDARLEIEDVLATSQRDLAAVPPAPSVRVSRRTKHPGLPQRIRAFGLLDCGPPRWVNTVAGTQLKLVVKEILRLP